MSQMTAYLEEYDRLKKLVVETSTAAETAAKDLYVYQTQTLPDALRDLGVDKVTFADGRTLSLEEFVSVKLPEEKEPSFDWLAKHGFGALVTCNVSALLDRSDDAEKRTKALQLLRGAGFNVEIKQALHPARLKSWAKDQLKNGATLPASLFTINTGSIAEIK